MSEIERSIIKQFGNKVRVRVCGICIENDQILLVNHRALNADNNYWMPPGGGMEFGLSVEENLKREFQEETGLEIEVNEFLFVHEYLNPPLHAIELFFRVRNLGGGLEIGSDPELEASQQIIKEVRFYKDSELSKINQSNLHQLFLNIKNISQIDKIEGYYKSMDIK